VAGEVEVEAAEERPAKSGQTKPKTDCQCLMFPKTSPPLTPRRPSVNSYSARSSMHPYYRSNFKK